MPSVTLVDPSAAEYPPNSPKKHRWPKIRRKKMRLAENPPNRKFAAAAEKNRGYCGAFNIQRAAVACKKSLKCWYNVKK